MTAAEEFAEFARVMSPRLRRMAFVLCGDWHTVEDLAQPIYGVIFAGSMAAASYCLASTPVTTVTTLNGRGRHRTIIGGAPTMLNRTRTIAACAAAAAAAGLAASLASPALAASTVARPHGQSRFTSNYYPASLATAAAISNREFAVWDAAVPAGSATVLTASFTVPTLACTTTDRAIGADAVVANRNAAAVSGVFIGCVSGAAVYFPWVLINGKEHDYSSNPVAAGDVIDLTTKVSTNRTRVQVTDVTSGVTQKIIGSGFSSAIAYVGDGPWFDSSGRLEHVPSFGKVTFKNCVLDAKSLASWRPRAFQRVNSIGTLQISTGNFRPGGTIFTTHFVHS